MSIFLKKEYAIQINPSTIYIYYKKKNLSKNHKKQKWYTPMKEPAFAEVSGENVQLDVKYVFGKEQT
jgi:hypothetical protein